MRNLFASLFMILFAMAHAQVDTIRWTELSPMPDTSQLNGSAYFLIDSDFYVAGGWLGNSPNTSSVVWKYHIPTDTWFQMSNLPFGGSSSMGFFTINGKGYFLTATDSLSNGNCDRIFWQYNPNGDIWTRKADFPDSPRQESTWFIYDGKGYVGETYGCNETDNRFWRYDPVTDQWSAIASLSNSVLWRSTAIAIPSMDKALVFGGLDMNAYFTNDVWKYTVSTDSWSHIGQTPGLGRELSVVWGLDSILLFGGGVVGDNHFNISLSNDYYKYNYFSNSWSPVVFENYFDSTAFGSTFIYGKRAYYFGGISSYIQPHVSNKMWSFDASKYIHDTGVGIDEVSGQSIFSVYPNPALRNHYFSVNTPEGGDLFFYDAPGRLLHTQRLSRGQNQMKLDAESDIIFYKALLQNGVTLNGKIVLVR